MKHPSLKILALLFITIASNELLAQNVGIGTTSPDTSALLELSSDSLGFLPPRMSTTDRDAIVAPAIGLMIYNTVDRFRLIGLFQYTNFCILF